MTKDASTLLKEAGLEPTTKRQYVLQRLLSATKALSAPQLLEQIERDKAMNKVTLYRILDKFVEKGVARRTTSADRIHRYCAGTQQGMHCHFHCTQCNKIYCLPLASEKNVFSSLDMPGGRIDHVEILYKGVCATCMASSKTDSPQYSP